MEQKYWRGWIESININGDDDERNNGIEIGGRGYICWGVRIDIGGSVGVYIGGRGSRGIGRWSTVQTRSAIFVGGGMLCTVGWSTKMSG